MEQSVLQTYTATDAPDKPYTFHNKSNSNGGITMSEKLTYPFKTMRITQTYNGGTSHRPHTTGSPKDYPIDEGGKDGGRDPMYAPCDVKIVRIYGVGNGGTNSMWVQSTKKVTLANGKTDFVTMQITHPNDSDLRRLKVGQVVRKRNVLCYEGTDGATGNHIHLSIGMGTMTGNGWTLNSNNKWVLTTSNGTVKPEVAFYVDTSFTNVVSSNGLKFKTLSADSPKVKEKYTTGEYKVTTSGLLHVRTGAGTKFKRVYFSKLTENAKAQVLKNNGNKKADGYVAGVECTVFSVKEADGYHWGKTPSGWIALEYCKKL